MFVRAKIDPMFDSVRLQVDALLEDIFQKTKVNAEKQVSDAEFAVQGMKRWFSGGVYASSADMQKYDSIRNKISDAKDKIETYSYFGYDDALKIMSETSKMVDEIQASIRTALDYSANECTKCNKKYCDIEYKKNYIIREDKKHSYTGGIGGIIFVIIYFMYIGMAMMSIIVGILFGYIIFRLLVMPIFDKVGLHTGTKEIRDLELDQKEIKNQIRDLKRRISAAEDSLL